MTHPILYSFRRCPYAMRARLAIYASQITVELREIVLRNKPAHMLEISPKGSVPVLQLHNGKVIDESLDIMIYALGRQDPAKQIPGICSHTKHEWLSGNEKETQALITQNDGAFKHALDRYKYPNRYPDEDCPTFKDNMFDRGAEILRDLNTRIEINGSLVTDYDTLADFAIFPFIRQFRNVDQTRFAGLNLTHLSQWLDRHLNSDLFNAIMHKSPR